MADSGRHRRRNLEGCTEQLTLDDWARDLAQDAQREAVVGPPHQASTAPRADDVAPLAAALAPRIAAELAARTPAATEDGTAGLVTLNQLVAELPPAKRPETWKRWLYERTRRGEIPGCVKLGGMLFFQRESAVSWLRAGMTAAK
jgi:hypothetical protein